MSSSRSRPVRRPLFFFNTAAALFYSAPPADVEHRPPSAGGRAKKTDGTTDHKWRIDPLSLLPEMGSFTPGSVNLNPIVYENSPQLVQDLPGVARRVAAAVLP